MAHLRAQVIVAMGIGLRLFLSEIGVSIRWCRHLSSGGPARSAHARHSGARTRGLVPRLPAQPPAHAPECRQHVGRDPVAAEVFEQVFLQPQQRIGHLGERGAVSQRAGLAVDQADVVPEVVEGLVTLEAPGIPCDFLAIGDELEGVR